MGNLASGKDARGQAWLRFGVLLGAALMLQGMPVLYLLLGGGIGKALYFANLYAALPLCALLIAYWAGLGGVHPMAAFFPVGGMELLLPVYRQPAVGLACLALSLVGSVAGNEMRNRLKGKKKYHGRK